MLALSIAFPMENGSLNDSNTLMRKYQETFPEDFNRLVIIDKGLAAYAKEKGMTIREFLSSYGYDMSGVPKNANLITSKAWADQYNVSRAFSALGGVAWYYSHYRGINVDAKVSGDRDVQFWTYGHNIWTDGYESHHEQGCAVII